MADHGLVYRCLVIPGLVLSLAQVVGCGGDDDDSSSETPAPTPTVVPATPTPELFFGEIDFTDLANDDVVVISLVNQAGERNLSTPVAFDVTDFTVAPEGQCGNEPDCGRVQLWIDDEFNSETSNPALIVADLNNLSNPLGAHTLALSLVYDDGSDTGAMTSVDVSLVAPPPTVTTVTPVNGTNFDYLTDITNGVIPVVTTVTNFLVSDSCDGQINCGMFRLFFSTADAPTEVLEDYVVESTGTQGDAGEYQLSIDLDTLSESNRYGELILHTQLINEDGDAYTNTTGGIERPVESVRTINIISPNDPRIVITAPTVEEGAATVPVDLGDDGWRTVPISFAVQNFTLSANCGSDPMCGHVRLFLNAGQGNVSEDEPYNNMASSGSTVDALFHYLDMNEGSATGISTVTVQLFNNNGEAILAGSAQVAASVVVDASYPDDYMSPVITLTYPQPGTTVRVTAQTTSVSFTYSLLNIDQAASQIKLYVDNNPTAIVTDTDGSPMTVLLSSIPQLQSEDGHRFTLQACNSGGTPLATDGVEVEDFATVVFTQQTAPQPQ